MRWLDHPKGEGSDYGIGETLDICLMCLVIGRAGIAHNLRTLNTPHDACLTNNREGYPGV